MWLSAFGNAAAIMARLHRIEPGAVGLESEPVIGPSAEVERWCHTLETVDAALVPGWRGVAAALESSAPSALPAAIVHGDFRLGNLLAVDDRITAVIDWEIWSVGDPRVDAGWFLINCDPMTYRRSAVHPTRPRRCPASWRRSTAKSWDAKCRNWIGSRRWPASSPAATWSPIVKQQSTARARPTRIGGHGARPCRSYFRGPVICSVSPAECPASLSAN